MRSSRRELVLCGSVHNLGMSARFYAPGAKATGELVTLPDDESQHLTKVLRLKAGAAVRVFNGRGAEFDALVERVTGSASSIRLGAPRVAAPEPLVAVTLAQAVLKSDKMDDVVRDAVMMGVAAIQPIVSERSEVSLSTLVRGRRRDRWERIAVASAKQCGRATVPDIVEQCATGDLVRDLAAGRRPVPALMLVEPGASSRSLPVYEAGVVARREATVIVGPEGGWSAGELDEASRVCRMITLGGRTLRADAAALVALAALFAIWKAF